MLIFGIDPGLNGAVAILEKNNIIDIFDMPTMAKHKIKDNLIVHLSKIFQNMLILKMISARSYANAMPGQRSQVCLILVNHLEY